VIYAVTAAQMREMDRVTIEEIGIPGPVLMETAGRRIAESIAELAAEIGGPIRVAAICGAGNNGGDGFVCARVLREIGVDAAVYLAMPAAKVGGDAALHLRAYRNAGGPVIAIDGAESLEREAASIRSADVICDALFGTGLTRDVEGHLAEVVELINRSDAVVVAADIPSGLSADTGQTLGVAVQADITVTMAFAKVGLVSDPGFVAAGELRIAEIGIPRSLAETAAVATAVMSPADAAALIPPIFAADHKGRRGHLLVVAGSPGKRGAGRLCARGALRSGAGLVTLASGGPEEIAVPDPVMSIALDTARSAEHETLLAGRDAVAIGPGLPTDAWGAALVRDLLAASSVPAVIDADGLNHLAGDLDAVKRLEIPVVLTPHPGEAARLLEISTAEVQSDRLSAARALAARTGAVCVLKGARTLVCDGRSAEGFATINPTGNPGMATAGSGDVLTGVIGALLAQGLDAGDAARLGVFVHGLAGDLAAGDLGVRSVTASDIAEALAAAFESLS
jgi:NAD(P)H-hydrate epimerase